MHKATRLKPLFHPGKLLVSPTALVALRANSVPFISVVLRRITGDWGIVSDDTSTRTTYRSRPACG